MSQPSSARDIETVAAEWAVCVDADAADPDEAALQAWLSADPRHCGAFLRAQAGLRLLDHGSVVRGILPLATEEWVPSRLERRLVTPWRLGLGLTALAASVAGLMLLVPADHDFSTSVGEQRRVALQDGSVAMINTDSRVDIAFAEDQRRITLDQGEAWFQVAKDHARPFIVDAGDVRVRATGTAFSVRRRGDSARVVVTEGRVIAWIDGSSHKSVAISAGEEATIARNLANVRPAHTEDALAWRRGEIVLNGQTVAAAAEEFNRYNERKIVVRNAKTANEKVVGYFLIDQPQQFAEAAAQMSGRRLSLNGKEIVIE
jgi:transmembrane sensor